MQLRNLTIPYAQPAVFAPMAGFTDAACRHLMADHGAAWTVSEMASAKAITFGDDKSVRLLRDKASHGIYAVQLFGAEPETMAQAIRIIQEKGVQFDILDINMGCPAPKITSSGAGSKLMQNPELCDENYVTHNGGHVDHHSGMFFMPIFLPGGGIGWNSYRYGYTSPGTAAPPVGGTVSNPNFTKPSGTTIKDTKGSTVQRGGFGINSKSGGFGGKSGTTGGS